MTKPTAYDRAVAALLSDPDRLLSHVELLRQARCGRACLERAITDLLAAGRIARSGRRARIIAMLPTHRNADIARVLGVSVTYVSRLRTEARGGRQIRDRPGYDRAAAVLLSDPDRLLSYAQIAARAQCPRTTVQYAARVLLAAGKIRRIRSCA